MQASKHVHRCPECGHEVERVHRHLGDRVVAILERIHRYRCLNAACGWEGIISLPSAAPAASDAPPITWKLRLLWLLVGAAIALSAVAGLKLYRDARTPNRPPEVVKAPAPLPVAAGEDFGGQSLPADDPRVKENPTDLTIRRGCVWGVPGGNPYKGTVHQALAAARLPAEVAGKIGTMIEKGIVSDRVVITRDAIHTTSGKRRFDATIPAMAFGKTVCFGTRVNFHAGHVEVADIYDAIDDNGATFTVMVPYVCGNISLLYERPPDHPHNGHKVPEPGVLQLLVLALGAMAVAARCSHSKRGRPPGFRRA